MIRIPIRTCLSILLLLCLAAVGPVLAGTFKGLQPGVSKKSDADATLGKPTKEVVKGERYDYDPGNPDTQRISILYNKATQTVEAIDTYPQGSFTKTQFKEWLSLTALAKSTKDKDGRLVEYYLSEGIALHFAGSDDSHPIKFFSHLDASVLSKKDDPKPAKKKTQGKTEGDYRERAEAASKAKDWETLKQAVDEGLTLYPNNAALWHERAVYYFNSNAEPKDVRNREVMNSAKRAYDLDPSKKHALDLAWVYLEVNKDYYSALRLFEDWEREYAPENPTLFYWMARCYEETGARSKARSYYERFLGTSPQGPKAADARQRLDHLK